MRLPTLAAVEKFITDLAMEASKRLENGGSAANPLAANHADAAASRGGLAAQCVSLKLKQRRADAPGAVVTLRACVFGGRLLLFASSFLTLKAHLHFPLFPS